MHCKSAKLYKAYLECFAFMLSKGQRIIKDDSILSNMERFQEEMQQIKEYLQSRPEGRSITEISNHLKVNRNSVAKYLDMLLVSGLLEVRQVGPARLYRLSHKLPTKALLDLGQEGILVLDEQRVVQANEEAARLLATPRETLIGARREEVDLIIQLGNKIPKRAMNEKKEFKKRLLKIRCLPTTFDDGSAGATLIIEDVTEEEATRERLLLLERAVEASSSGISIADMRQKDMPLIYVNKAFEKLTGYKKREVLGKNCRFLQGDDRDQEAIRIIKDSLAKGKECTVELRNYKKDGSLFWNELHMAPVKDEKGTITHFVGVQTVISKRK
jgi:PAS domain S-box-containing protein